MFFWPGSCCNSHSHSLGTALIWRLLHLKSFIRSSQEEAAGSSSLASLHLYSLEPGLNLCAPCSKPYEMTWTCVTDTDLMGLSSLLHCQGLGAGTMLKAMEVDVVSPALDLLELST